MLNKQNGYTSTVYCHFLRQNHIIGKYFYLLTIISQNKIASINLFLIT